MADRFDVVVLGAANAGVAAATVAHAAGRSIAVVLGHDAEEVIELFGFAMRNALGAGAIEDMVVAYPTFSSDAKYLI
jgi:pyruvate/2-oxoglutarate dehydrogenase complex dihydrolipoamide dehydrogenase (E3) component